MQTALALGLGALLLAGCEAALTDPGGTGGDGTTAVADVEVTPGSASVAPGNTVQLEATVTDSAGNEMEASVSWSSSNTEVATVDGNGIVTGQSAGTAAIEARSGDAADTASVEVTSSSGSGDATVSNLTPSSYETDTLETGVEYYIDRDYTLGEVSSAYQGWTLIRTANDDKHSTADTAITFELSDSATVAIAYDKVATSPPGWLAGWTETGDSLDLGGGASSPMPIHSRAFGPGTVALGGNMSDGAEGATTMYVPFVSVDPPSDGNGGSGSVASVTVSPSSATVDSIGTTTQFSAEATDGDGNVLSGVSFSWVSSNTSVATVDADGTATAQGEGSTTISAAADGVADSATLTVVTGGAGSISVVLSPESVTLSPGQSQQFSAEATKADGNVIPVDVEWGATGGTITSEGLYTAGSSGGSYQVTATDTSGASGTADVFIDVGAPQSISELPEATGQVPRWSELGSFPSAGGSYQDPTSGVRVWRVTDESTDGGAGMQHVVNDKPVHISKPKNGVYTVFFEGDFGDIWSAEFEPGVGLSNYREWSPSDPRPASGTPNADDFTLSFVDPDIMYYVDDTDGIWWRKYNIATETEVSDGFFPVDLQAVIDAHSELSDYVQIAKVTSGLNDEWQVLTVWTSGSEPTGLIVVNTVDETVQVRDWEFGEGNNRASSDLSGRYVYMPADVGQTSIFWDLETGTDTEDPQGTSINNHIHPGFGHRYMLDTDANSEMIYRQDLRDGPRTDVADASKHTIGGHHYSANWDQGGASPDFWAIRSSFVKGVPGADYVGTGSFAQHDGEIWKTTNLTFDWAENSVRAVLQSNTWGQGPWLASASSVDAMSEGSFHWDAATGTLYVWKNGGGDPTDDVLAFEPKAGFAAIMFLRADGSEYRFLAHHWSLGDNFFTMPRATISPDGRVVMFSSDMNGSGRTDVFLVEVP